MKRTNLESLTPCSVGDLAERGTVVRDGPDVMKVRPVGDDQDVFFSGVTTTPWSERGESPGALVTCDQLCH